MSDGGEGRAGAPPPPSSPAEPRPGWYPDPWTPARRRYWTGSSWTFATTDAARIDDPPPPDASPLPPGHGLPAPVAPRPAAPPADGSPGPAAPRRQRPVKWLLAVVVGLIVGFAGLALTNRSSSKPESSSSGSAAGTEPTSEPPLAVPPDPPSVNNDPSTAALASLVVKEGDVPSTARVLVFPGGIGLGQPTLDLCNATFPSESRRAARIQDARRHAEQRDPEHRGGSLPRLRGDHPGLL